MADRGPQGEVDPDAFFAPAPWSASCRRWAGGCLPSARGGAPGQGDAHLGALPSVERGDHGERGTHIEVFWNQRRMFEWVDQRGERLPTPGSLPAGPEKAVEGEEGPEDSQSGHSPWSSHLRYFSRQRRVAKDASGQIALGANGQAGCPAPTQRSREYLCASFAAYWKCFLRESALPATASEETGSDAPANLRLPPNCREPPLHDYELIREGRPCRLYYDLEYNQEANPDVDGPEMVHHAIFLTREVLRELFDVSLKFTQVLELDSSSPRKFSRHLIFHLEGSAGEEVAFRNNLDAGAVARAVVERSAEKSLFQDPGIGIFVAKETGGKCIHPIIDLGVYTRNRVFRMYGFSKEGKGECLLPTRRFMGSQLPACPKGVFCLETFRASLVTFVGGKPGLTSVGDRVPCRLLECEDDKVTGPPKFLSSSDGIGPRGPPNRGPKRRGPDPPEKVLSFLGCKAAELGRESGGAEGWVRSFVSLSPRAVVFNLSGTRFCPRIGREHKSNGVYFMADLDQGFWWQKCYDPDCRYFSTAAQAFPADVWQPSEPQLRRQVEGSYGGTGTPGRDESGVSTDCDDLLVAVIEEYEEDAALEKVMETIEGRGAGPFRRGC